MGITALITQTVIINFSLHARIFNRCVLALGKKTHYNKIFPFLLYKNLTLTCCSAFKGCIIIEGFLKSYFKTIYLLHFGHARPTPIYLNREILKSQNLLAKLTFK